VKTNTLLMLVLATAVWLAVVVAAALYIASRNPVFWFRTIIMVATVLYLVAVRLILIWNRRSKPCMISAKIAKLLTMDRKSREPEISLNKIFKPFTLSAAPMRKA